MPNAISNIIIKELRIAYRRKVVLALGILFVALSSLSYFASYGDLTKKQTTISTEKAEKRQEWLNQGDKHPHIAAHYGTYVFKPKSLLSIYETGLDIFTGTSIYLEAHFQHEFMFRPAQDKGSLARFSEMNMAMILRLLLPLLIIILTFGSVSEELESGTLRLMVAQGVSTRDIIWGKVWANCLILILILLPVTLLAGGGFIFIKMEGLLTFSPFRLLALFLSFVVYLFVFVMLSVLASFYSRTSRNALLKLLVLWILFTVLMPKTIANIGRSMYSLPSMDTYKSGIKLDIDMGLDGKSPRSVRLEQLKKETLEVYEIDSIHLLPINFGGLSMQAGEDYGNKVYDLHSERLHSIFDKQNKLFAYSSILNPYIAIQRLSLAFAGTDMETAVNFENEVENYRRDLVRKMNGDMTNNSKFGEFYEYTAGLSLWEELEDFTYVMPSMKQTLRSYRWECVSLIIWVLATSTLLNFAASSKRWEL